MAAKTTEKAAPKKAAPKKASAKKAGAKKAGGKTKASAAASASERIDRYIASIDDWRGELLARIRAVFLATDPAMVEEWKWMGSPVWSCDGMIAVANAHKEKVKVTFSHGAQLADPHGLFNAGLGGKKWRAIDLHEGDALDEPALQAMIERAIRYNASRAK